MRYVSVDIETTGLDQERYSILSIGAIIEDTSKKLSFEEIPKFHVAIKHPEIIGSLFALNMNKNLIEAIAQYQDTNSEALKSAIMEKTGLKFLNEDEVVEEFFDFLYINGISDLTQDDLGKIPMKRKGTVMVPTLVSKIKPTTITVAGKNFSTFDKKFLERLPRWKQAIRIKQRIIDPAVLFVDWQKDECLPSLGDCKQRAGIEGIVSHNALEDAWDVIQLLRKFY